MLHWIVQENLFHRENQQELISCLEQLERGGVSYSLVVVRPFIHTIEPDVTVSGNIMVCGATSLINIARKRNWYPGAFEAGDFDDWKLGYGDCLLNYDSEVCRFGDVNPSFEPFFIRPYEDTKTFTGFVTTKHEFNHWREKLGTVTDGFSTLTGDTLVTVSSVKDIQREYRFFVVDGQIVTGSLYKMGDRPLQSRIIDDDVLAFAKEMVTCYQPDRAFVLDVAMLEDSLKVIELNCFNASGYYACDISKIVGAIETARW